MQISQHKTQEKYCFSCGSQIHLQAEICPKCGVRQSRAVPFEIISRRSVAALLALLLGSLGIHKFFLGKIVAGIIYLIFCWTGIPTLISLVEGIIYFSMSDEDFDNKYSIQKASETK